LEEENIMGTPVTVPMVGKIVSVSVKVGDKIKEDDQVAVLEAMKMEMPIVAPITGTVKEICVGPGQEIKGEGADGRGFFGQIEHTTSGHWGFGRNC
jgi:acetyl-CoA carboxylase biotin carboxyl carrier protein